MRTFLRLNINDLKMFAHLFRERRERDSNSRMVLPIVPLARECLQPLGHLSTKTDKTIHNSQRGLLHLDFMSYKALLFLEILLKRTEGSLSCLKLKRDSIF